MLFRTLLFSSSTAFVQSRRTIFAHCYLSYVKSIPANLFTAYRINKFRFHIPRHRERQPIKRSAAFVLVFHAVRFSPLFLTVCPRATVLRITPEAHPDPYLAHPTPSDSHWVSRRSSRPESAGSSPRPLPCTSPCAFPASQGQVTGLHPCRSFPRLPFPAPAVCPLCRNLPRSLRCR